MSLQSCLFNNNKHLLHWRGGVLPYRVPPGGSPRNIPSQMWGHRGPLSRELNPGAAGPGIGASPINLKQNMKPRHFSFVGHCRGQGEDTTLGQTLIYFSKFFTKFRRNSGKPLLSCPQVNSVNCSNECYVRGPQHVILPYFNHFSDVHGLCQFRRDSVYLFLFMTRHQQERSSGQVLSLLTFIIKNESPRHVGLRHRIRIGELQLSWQNRPAGYSRLSIPPD